MDVQAYAVTGAAGLVGARLLPRLAELPDTARIVALDVREPRRRVRTSEFHRVDVAGADLAPLLEGVDVVVHLAGVVDPIVDEALMARVNVGGTRRVLDAAAKVGVRRIVRVSSATVYGAWPDNPVPIREDRALRPNPSFSPATQAAEVERLLGRWGAAHPTVVVTTLRAAPVVGPGAARLPSRVLVGRGALRVRGARPPAQFVHVDDLASALALVASSDHPGVFNVAADGWLGSREQATAAGRPWLPPLPEGLLRRMLAVLWRTGIGDVPPALVPYLRHPWVLSNERLRAAGWEPRYDNTGAVGALSAGR